MACFRFFLLCYFLGSFLFSFSQGSWTQKANFPAGGRNEAIAFPVGMKGYFGMGTEILGPRHNDIWEYDPALNSWTPKDSMPGQRRWGAFSFAIGNKGYVGTGFGSSPYLQDFWEYDPQTNAWMQKASFAGAGRYSAFGLSIGNKGYAGTGYTSSGYAQDFYEYDPVLNQWTPKANFGGGPRQHAVAFSIGNAGYAGTGTNGTYFNDLWKYDPATNAWSALAPYPGNPRLTAAVFVIGNYGYLGTGWTPSQGACSDFYKYDPVLNAWSPIASFPTVREGANFVSIGQKGYVGNGNTGMGPNYQIDWWEYNPDSILTTVPKDLLPENVISCSIYPSPASDHLYITLNTASAFLPGKTELRIYNASGKLLRLESLAGNTTALSIHTLAAGLYFYSVTVDGVTVGSDKFIVRHK